MSISYIDEIYIIFIDDPSKINLNSIRTLREDTSRKNNPLSRRSFVVSNLDIPTETKNRLTKNNIVSIK